jgi:hypothetical protein
LKICPRSSQSYRPFSSSCSRPASSSSLCAPSSGSETIETKQTQQKRPASGQPPYLSPSCSLIFSLFLFTPLSLSSLSLILSLSLSFSLSFSLGANIGCRGSLVAGHHYQIRLQEFRSQARAHRPRARRGLRSWLFVFMRVRVVVGEKIKYEAQRTPDRNSTVADSANELSAEKTNLFSPVHL